MARNTALRWLDENLDDDVVLGAFNSGHYHYRSETRRFHNLDGRVDDGSFYRRLVEGGTVEDYVRSRGVTHVVDRAYPTDINYGAFWRRALQDGKLLAQFPVRRDGSDAILVVEMPPPRPVEALGGEVVP